MNSHLPQQLSALLTPGAYPHETGSIRLVETHVAWVLLAGEFAYKIKRPVCYPFLDMRTVEQRRFFCEEEIRLNRRFAPELYLKVVPITVDAGQPRIEGSGEVVEHAVQMRRFDTSEELSCLLAEQRVSAESLGDFGRVLAGIHASLPVAEPSAEYGRPDSVRRMLLENLRQLSRLAQKTAFEPDCASLEPLLDTLLQRNASFLETRRSAGRVRECHGDLHCGNVVRVAGRLVAFDCLEFAPEFRFIDVAEDIAFLYMDLIRRGGESQAAAFLNAWLETSGDYEASRLIGLYGAHRALVRAKVAALEASQSTRDDERHEARASYDAYLSCARLLLALRSPALVLMSGLSGSGKTWVATQLAQSVGAIHIRSDLERKRLAGLPGDARSGSQPGAGLYSAEASDRTYRRLAECASDALAGGFIAIIDATFQRREDRSLLSRIAADANVPLMMFQCQAPDAVLEARIRARAREGRDASEADVAVLEWQRAHYEHVDRAEQIPVIEVDTTGSAALADVKAALLQRLRSSA